MARACAATLSISLVTGAFAQSAPSHSPPSQRSVRVAQADVQTADMPAPAADDASTLVLTPTDGAPPEITGTLIMRLVAQANREEPREEVSPELASQLKDKAVQQALRLRGSRYRYGGTSRGGFDCSGFVQYVYARMGVGLPRSSPEQFHCGKPVSRAALKPGDLVFFGRGGRYVGHVGIYVGQNRFVHAANPGRGVTTDSLSSSYYSPRYRGARRIRGS